MNLHALLGKHRWPKPDANEFLQVRRYLSWFGFGLLAFIQAFEAIRAYVEPGPETPKRVGSSK